MKKIVTWISIMLLGFLIIFSITSLLGVKNAMNSSFTKVVRPDYTITAGIKNYDEVKEEYKRENISFYSNDNQLTGYIYGNNNDKALIVLAHGLGGGADDYLPQIMFFVDNGYKVFAYNCTGSYESEGKSTIGFTQSVIDLDAALNYVEENNALNTLDILLFGHSWGGYAVANILNYDHDIKAVVSVAGVNSAKSFVENEMIEMLGWFGHLEKPYLAMYQHYLFGSKYKMTAVNGINKSNISVLLIHGEDDNVVVYDRDSIIHQKSKITNEKVEYITTTGIHGGHMNLFRSEEAVNYSNDVNAVYRVLYDSYNGKIPYTLNQAFYAKLDNKLISDLNLDLMNSILEFYDQDIQ